MVVFAWMAAPGTPRMVISSRYATVNMFPGWAGTPWVTTSAPLPRMAVTVRSSGSTLMPPVITMSFAPRSRHLAMAASSISI